MGWLNDFTAWLLKQLKDLWENGVEFFEDLLLQGFENWLAMVYLQWSLIPAPDFLNGFTLCTLLTQAGPTVGWALNTFRVGEALGFIAAGYSFRMLRKLATLFQW
ncbi:phage coat protein [Xanthomonas sp. XNM01]|uniref:phage coat protein n=1 Tax=Xanthomonas sp. XNM01 TaxID=2769289 RepID=UPI0017837C57|nr:phage coat protein [Xanthomonas sp. XNM01]MBD9368373.1 phage coat protein [Xanthomonas sp. XNM01]